MVPVPTTRSEKDVRTTQSARAATTASRLAQHRQTIVLFIPVALLWIALAFLSPNFLTGTNISNIFVNAAPLALAAAGLTLVIIGGDLDLSVGSTIALSSTAIGVLTVRLGVPWPLAVLAAIAVGLIVGLTNGLAVTRLAVPSFICTLAMMSVVRGFALVISDGRAVSGLPPGIQAIARTRLLGLSLVIWIPIAVIVLLGFLLARTSLGLNIYAIGGNREAARIAGVDIRRTRMALLVISGLMGGIGGVISTARLGVGSPIIADDLILDAIAAVVIGGTSLFGGVGRMGGTVLGVVLIATIRNGLVLLDVSAFYQRVAIGLVILAASTLDAFGRRGDE